MASIRKLIFNPFTGSFDWISEETGSVSSNSYEVDKITLDTTNITNKYVVLENAPTNKPDVRLIPIGGTEQDYGTDFIVTTDDGNKRLSWNGLGLESLLSNGDKIIVVYY